MATVFQMKLQTTDWSKECPLCSPTCASITYHPKVCSGYKAVDQSERVMYFDKISLVYYSRVRLSNRSGEFNPVVSQNLFPCSDLGNGRLARQKDAPGPTITVTEPL